MGAPFPEDTTTQVVNAHGALVLLKQMVSLGGRLRIKNTKTGEEIPCTVVDVESSSLFDTPHPAHL